MLLVFLIPQNMRLAIEDQDKHVKDSRANGILRIVRKRSSDFVVGRAFRTRVLVILRLLGCSF